MTGDLKLISPTLKICLPLKSLLPDPLKHSWRLPGKPFRFIHLKTTHMKQVVVLFNFPNVSLKQYDNVWADLRAAGQSKPKGLVSHVGAASGNNLVVVDIWESRQAFDEFGKILMPLIAKQDIPTIQPQILDAHYVLVTQTRSQMA